MIKSAVKMMVYRSIISFNYNSKVEELTGKSLAERIGI